jgi:hypothetical protein
MKTIKLHPEKSIRCTENALMWCSVLNHYRKEHPKASFREMGEQFGMTETNARRYYYGIHHYNSGYDGKNPYNTYTQLRKGACVQIA